MAFCPEGQNAIATISKEVNFIDNDESEKVDVKEEEGFDLT